MKKIFFYAAVAASVLAVSSCSCQNNGKQSGTTATKSNCPEYTVVNSEQVDLSAYTKDADGYYVIFDGKSLDGWRGYGKNYVPARWTVEDGCLKFNGTGTGEGQTAEGGDIIFAHKFQNFII